MPKPKQRRQAKKRTRNRLELPSDLMVNILQRIDALDILENVQYVCKAWHEICKDPVLWRVLPMDGRKWRLIRWSKYREVCKRAVDRSQGQLVDLTLNGIYGDEILQYAAERSGQLRRLQIVNCIRDPFERLTEALKKLPLLEELSLCETYVFVEWIEVLGHYCPLLKTLKIDQEVLDYGNGDDESHDNEIALAIGERLPQLTHLELIWNNLNNTGLKAILDGCHHLESLDLRHCFNVYLKGELGRRCSQQIKDLKLPGDFHQGCLFIGPYSSEASDDDDYEG